VESTQQIRGEPPICGMRRRSLCGGERTLMARRTRWAFYLEEIKTYRMSHKIGFMDALLRNGTFHLAQHRGRSGSTKASRYQSVSSPVLILPCISSYIFVLPLNLRAVPWGSYWADWGQRITTLCLARLTRFNLSFGASSCRKLSSRLQELLAAPSGGLEWS
jgi:hypothetical protein